MPDTIPSPLQAKAYAVELATQYALGALGTAAGVQVAPKLRDEAAGMFADFAQALDVDPETMAAMAADAPLPVTSGWAWGPLPQTAGGWADWLARSTKALASAAQSILKGAQKYQGALLTFGGIYLAHSFLTQDERVRLDENRLRYGQAAEIVNKLPPAEQAAFLKAITGQAGSVGFNTVLLVGLGVAALWIVMGKRKP